MRSWVGAHVLRLSTGFPAELKPFYVLGKLGCAGGASWDPKRACLPGTRVNAWAGMHDACTVALL